MVVLLLGGCGSSPRVHFYTLDPRAAQGPVRPVQIAKLRVAAVHIPSSLDRQEMTRETAPNTLQIRDRDCWGAPLDEMMRRVLTQDLAQRLPRGVVVFPGSTAAGKAAKIVVTVLEFDENAAGDVVLDGEWSLVTASSAKPTLSRYVHLTQPAGQGSYADQAKAMSNVVGRLADDIARRLENPAT